MRLPSRGWLGMQSPEGLAEAGGSTSKMVHSHGYWPVVSAPYWLFAKELIFSPRGTATGLLEHLHSIAAGFPKTE